MYPLVGWWLERRESTADLARRAHQQKLCHFYALRRFGAALHCGKMGPGRLPSSLCGGETISLGREGSSCVSVVCGLR